MEMTQASVTNEQNNRSALKMKKKAHELTCPFKYNSRV